MLRTICAALALALFAVSAGLGETLYVSPQGSPQGAGTKEQPLDLKTALERAGTRAEVREVILAGGAYSGQFTLPGPKDVAVDKLPPLVVRAADGEKPLLVHSARIDKAEPVEGLPGLFRTRTMPPNDVFMWERDTRVRYITLSNRASVAAVPGSCFADRRENWLYFSTSDGQAPDRHEVGLALSSRNSRAMAVYRHNATFEGLSFRDYVGANVACFQTYADNVTIRRCHMENGHQGWVVWTNSRNGVMEDCSGADIAQPVYSFAKDVVVRRCRFEKTRDRFLLPLYPQNDTAYQVYGDGSGGVFEFNFCKGYANGIWIKSAAGRYVIRHNTVVDAHYGICWVTNNANSDTSHNLIVGADDFIRIENFEPTYTQDYNLFWSPKNLQAFGERLAVTRGANREKHGLLADPRFVDPANGDYRLLPDSPALAVKDAEGLPAGAFGVAPVEAAAKAAPTLEIAFTADTRPMGVNGEMTFERDPWIGGGVTRVRDLVEPGALPRRLTGRDQATVLARAFDATGRVVKTRIAWDGKEPEVTDYQPQQTLKLPPQDATHRVRVEAQSDRGVWSAPVEFDLRRDTRPPQLLGDPQVFANDHGLIVAFQTDEPCFARLEYGPTTAYGGSVQTPKLVKRFWDANDGGEWVETWTVPRSDFALALLRPAVTAGQTVHLRVVLEDDAGLKTEGKDFTTVVRGKPRDLHVSPKGKDDPGGGGRETPFRTIQYAADRALPGDRVVVGPGVYTQLVALTHGGVAEDARLTIEAEQPDAATLDTAMRENACIHLESAPFVTVRNLRLLYFKKAGVYAYRSPHTRIERCTVFNGVGWETGYNTFCFYSPHSTVTRCLAVGAEIGFYFLKSPHATVTHNTYSQGMYAAAAYPFSLAGTRQMYNCFSFAGNDIYSGEIEHPEDLKTFRSDYNNLGTNVTEYNAAVEQRDPALWKLMKAEEFAAPKYPGHYIRTGSKSVIGIGRRFRTLKEWRESSGQDAHSIFADPKWVWPIPPIDSWDWRVKPDSPNIGLGEGGAPLGAFDVAK